MEWLNALQDATSEAETPKSFIYWAGLTIIAAVANNSVYLNRRGEDGRIIYQLNPNLYIMLIADSGLGKGLPVAIAKEAVSRVNNTRVISGRNSIEGIIHEMSLTASVNGRPPLTDARAFIVSGEFSTLMLSNPQALNILTEWYDTHFMKDWPNTLKNSPVEKLKGVNVTLLGASSPEHFAEAVPEVNIRGGFIGRTLLVYEEKRYRTNPLVMINEPMEEEIFNIVTPDLLDPLMEIAKLKGRFHWTTNGAEVFIPWYNDWRGKQFNDKTGTVQRMPDHVLKVAMCLSMSRKTDLSIDEKDIQEAIDSCLSLTINTKRVTAHGSHPLSEMQRLVLDFLYKAPEYQLARQRILQKGYGDIDAPDLDRVEQTLMESRYITVGKKDGKTSYKLTDAAIQRYKRLTEE